jgi:uncharacterized membrane protein YphA (DoxX/SURF4 family)
MRLPLKAGDLPGRIATGAFILHSGWEKWHAGQEQAERTHATAAGAYPFLGKLPPQRFMRMLAVGEMTVGSLLLAPVVPTGVAGAALTGFSGALVGMYVRTPALHRPHSVWPSPNGIAVAKDSWMLGLGLGYLIDAASQLRRG